MYKDCSGPITSFGIIAFKIVRNREEEKHDINSNLRTVLYNVGRDSNMPVSYSSLFSSEYPVIKFLLIQRKDTMGYIDFIRGKYPEHEPTRTQMLNVYLSEMTIDERAHLRQQPFDALWDRLWVNHESKCYKNEYESAKRKYERLDVPALIDATKSSWTFQEFGMPKGRRNMRETNISCAEREFGEETGYRRGTYEFVQNYPVIEEEFTGTNGVQYRHIYYLVKMKEPAEPPVLDAGNKLQTGEVQNIGWFSYEQCIKLLRPYDIAKKNILTRVYNDLLLMNNRFVCSEYYYKRRHNNHYTNP